MSDPYEILELSPAADEAEVRRKYLELVRRHPPERAPERFADIRTAYEELRDPARRLEHQLFEFGIRDSLEEIIAEARSRLCGQTIPTDTLLSLADLSPQR